MDEHEQIIIKRQRKEGQKDRVGFLLPAVDEKKKIVEIFDSTFVMYIVHVLRYGLCINHELIVMIQGH